MAITATHLKIAIRGTFMGQEFQNVQWYRLGGAAFLTADPVGVGEAFWNDIKTPWRAMNTSAVQFVTSSIFVAEPGVAGQYGEYAIPTAEQHGTRAISTLDDLLPPFCAAGVRLTVGSRETRPGQKRFCGLYESDNVAGGFLSSTYTTLLTAVVTRFSSDIVLGAPVATGVLIPVVARLDPGTKEVLADQDVTGFIIAPEITTQNSRKYGHGS